MATYHQAPAERRGRYNRSLSATERRRERRSAILGAALELVATEGVRAVTVDRVIGLAAVGRNTLYDHFEHIDDLLGELTKDLTARVAHRLDPAQRSARTLRGQLLWLVQAWLELAREPGGALEALLGPLRPQRQGSSAAVTTVLLSVLEQLVGDPRAATTLGAPPARWQLVAACGVLEATAFGLGGAHDADARATLARAGAPPQPSADALTDTLLAVLRHRAP